MTRPQEPSPLREARLREAPPITFTSTSFQAFLNTSSLRVNSNGQLLVSLVIPAEHVEAGLELRHLCQNPMPLQIDVSVYEPYLDDLAASEQRIKDFANG